MLSRIARGLYDLGRLIERSRNVARILEVNHKVNLERSSRDETEIWSAVSKAFGCDLSSPDESSLYEALVLSPTHPHSVRRCITEARDEGRAMRNHISEEMWLHLNRQHLDFQNLTFADIRETGRSEFNRRVEIFADGLHGLADDTMIRDHSWAFLKLGKLMERSLMVCQILEIKRTSITANEEGRPVDVYQWQALLRSLAGYEPYRRAYDARVVPERVLEFVLKRPEFPRSLTWALGEIQSILSLVSNGSPMQVSLERRAIRLQEDLQAVEIRPLLSKEALQDEIDFLKKSIERIIEEIELAYFTSHRPASIPINVAHGAGLVSQQ